jgi:hypothetical protein
MRSSHTLPYDMSVPDRDTAYRQTVQNAEIEQQHTSRKWDELCIDKINAAIKSGATSTHCDNISTRMINELRNVKKMDVEFIDIGVVLRGLTGTPWRVSWDKKPDPK